MLLHELIRPFPDALALAFDIETTGLSPTDDHPIVISIANETGKTLTFDFREHDPEAISAWIENHIYDRMVIAHNLSFDAGFLRYHYQVPHPERLWCTWLAEQLVNAGLNTDNSLAGVMRRRMNVELDKTLQTSFTLDGELSPEQIEYAESDVADLYRIMLRQQDEITLKGLESVWEIEQAALPVFSDMWRVGVKVDREILDPLVDAEREKMETLRAQLEATLSQHIHWKRIADHDEQLDALHAWLAELDEVSRRAEHRWLHATQEWREYARKHITTKKDLANPSLADTWTSFIGEDAALWREAKYGNLTPHKETDEPLGMRRYRSAAESYYRADHPRPTKPKLDTSPINLNSRDQVLYAFHKVGLHLPDLRKETTKIALADTPAEQRDAYLEPYIAYKKSAKLVQSFGEALIARTDSHGTLHGGWKQIGTATGRPACAEPNMLQIPSKGEVGQRFRSAFRARPGRSFVIADFSQMELRLMAELSGDEVMTRAFQDNKDLHILTAAGAIHGSPDAYDQVTDTERSTGKTINFLVQYGGGKQILRAKLAENGTHVSDPEAGRMLDGWRTTYAGVDAWLNRQHKMVMAMGHTASPFGRKRFFRFSRRTPRHEVAAIQRAAANHPIQSSNADITKLAMVEIQRRLEPLFGTIILQVYDEIVVEVPTEFAYHAGVLTRGAMLAAAEMVLQNVPAQVDCVVSPSWAEAEGVPLEEFRAATQTTATA